MLRTIFVAALFFVIAALFTMWLWAGGYQETVAFVRSIPNPIDIVRGTDNREYKVRLPWEVAPPRGAELRVDGYAASESPAIASVPGNAGTEPDPFDLSEARNFGTPSPLRDKVTISEGGARESDQSAEYVVLTAAYENEPLDLSGWSLQSARTGARIPLPGAAEVFMLGAVNAQRGISLGPGESIIVSSGPSPVGVSFRESRCTGFLAGEQHFQPEIANACPSSGEIVPHTEEVGEALGAQCLEFMDTIPPCTYPSRVPQQLSARCKQELATKFTYAGCLISQRTRPGFLLDSWRVYLGSPAPYWHDEHDTIRLLDREGRIVSVVNY